MPRTQPKKQAKKKHSPSLAGAIWGYISFWYRSKHILKKCLIWLMLLLAVWVGISYAIAQWYIYSNKNKPYTYGVTFIPNYARFYGLDPQETMQSIIDDLGVRKFRLVSYWKDGEPSPGVYNFDELDWQFKKAEAAGAKVSLAIGLRQPRWPECHMPTWAESMTMQQWLPPLKAYMKQVIERYKDSPALESYQLENEFFMTVFGICPDFTRERLVEEYEYVKSLDSEHPVIISRSNNWIGIPVGDPRPDEFGISVYKRVWDKSFTKRYFEYPLPAWFYATLAGTGKILTGKDMIIHELQAEPWLPEGFHMNSTELRDIREQDKSMNAARLHQRFNYARGSGMHEAYLWGVEWWYWRKEKVNDPTIWDAARDEFTTMNRRNQSL